MGEGSKRRRISSDKDKAGKAETKPKYSSWSWSDLPDQLLGLILGKLSLVDIIHCCAVCSSWRSTAQSCSQSTSTTPWLMLPSDEKDDSTTRCFFNLAENKVYKMKNAFEGFGEDAWCVGSSHGWLVILDDEAIPHLFNPFSRVRIRLPSIPNEFLSPNIDRDYFVRYLRKIFIAKAVLLTDPSRSNNFGLVVICGSLSRLAFCKEGDTTWTELAVRSLNTYQQYVEYSDIICHDNQVYVLASDASVEVWDFRSSFPTKIMSIDKPSTLQKVVGNSFFIHNLSPKFYLVKTSTDFLFIKRFIGDYVNAEGLVVDEDYVLYNSEICPYRTKLFYVYRLNFRQNTWEQVESLNDQVVFLGGNQSISLSSHDLLECIPDSIYFTDDRWDEMDVDDSYGGHDIGFFNLDDQSIKPYYHLNLARIDPPSFWITPNLSMVKD